MLMENIQTTSHLLMVRPARFAFNEETAGNNAFQQRVGVEEASLLQQEALEEFDAFVSLLREQGVEVTVVQDTPTPFTPDSIFPNNCFSTHHDESGRTLVLYPMFAPNRRLERERLLPVLAQMHFDKVVDLTHWEEQGKFLEGTGSLILDREHHMAFACRSPRTHEEVVADWARQMGYDYYLFDSVDEHGMPVYHTNVVMHIGTHIAIVCTESIPDDQQRQTLLSLLEANGKQAVSISMAQVIRFAGNMLELRSLQGEPLLVMSSTAKASLTPRQAEILSTDMRLVVPHIPHIETAGGGSARCMMAELF